MARFTITLRVEGVLAATGTSPLQDLLGRVVTVELAGPEKILTAADVALLTPLLSPWRWQIGWNVGGTLLSSAIDPTLAGPLDARLEDILTRCQTDPSALQLLRFRNAETDPPDASEEDDPIWPGFLAQFGRLGPQLTHPLGLGYIHQLNGPLPAVEISAKAITIGTRTYTVGDTGDPDVELVCPSEIIWALAPGRSGLIERVERLVVGAGSETIAEWLSELPIRLGVALDPLSRLADIREILPFPLAKSLRATLDTLFVQPAFASIVLAIIDACSDHPGEEIDAKRQAANQWASALSASRDAMVSTLAGKFTEMLADETWTATDFRNIHASSDIDRVVQAWLQAAWPHTTPYEANVTTWLGSASNAGVVLRRILPEALSSARLLPPLIDKIKANQEDWGPLKKAFNEVFIEVLLNVARIDTPRAKLLPLAERLKAIAFALHKDSIDIGARDGLPFRVDTVFGETRGDDLHLLLDGYVAAVATHSGAGYGPYELVSRGMVTIDTIIKGASASRPVSNVTTALPVTFEMSRSTTATTAETRRAIACYRGEALIPWSDRGVAQLQAKSLSNPGIEIRYAPEGIYPTLAFGRDYRVAVGYPAPGGILPMGFATRAAPTHFMPDTTFIDAAGAGPRFVEIAFRRTLAPSAPQLLTFDGKQANQDIPLVTSGPVDQDVRPLWKEHVERWSSTSTKDRDALRDASTIFLDGLKQRTRAFEKFTFAIKAPALALGADDPNATNARLWHYWRERDGDGAAPPAKPLKRSSATHYVDDPAVVGPVRTPGPNRGGVELKFQRILVGGLAAPDILSVPLAEDDTIIVRLEPSGAGTSTGSMVLQRSAIPQAHEIVVTVPPGTRWSLSARTMCDARFFQGGGDCRFGDLGILEQDASGHAFLFGAATIAIEALPEIEHLPASDSLWRSLQLEEDALGQSVARFGDKSGPMLDPSADYIGSIRTTRQRWRWDGGPVPRHSDFKIAWNMSEPDDATRSFDFLAFEKAMFLDRGHSGTQETVQHVAGTAPKLFGIEHGANRGGDYLRASMMVTSRYAAFRAPSDPDGTYLRRTARLGAQSSATWRGRLIGPRRRDPLPTPRIGVAAPLFGTVGMATSLTGGVGLYIDHPMYDPRHGGGLAEVLQVRVMVDTVDLLLDAPKAGDGKTASLAVGLDATLFEAGDPFDPKHATPASTVAFEKAGKWGPAKTGGWSGEAKDVPRFEVRTVLGQTLEISSAAPRLNYAIAFVEPALGGKPLLPGTIARVQVRCAADGVAESDWSAAIWIYFLPNSSGYVEIGGASLPLFHATRSATEVKLEANPYTGPSGVASLARLTEAIADAPEAGTDKAYLVRGVWGVLVRAVRDVRGDDALRVIDVVRGRTARDGSIHFDLRPGQEPGFVRILDIQFVNSATIPQPFGLDEATKRWFGTDLGDVLERKVIAGASPDIGERVVGIGPLVQIS